MTHHQKLTIMAILGLPGLPLAIMWWLMRKYIFADNLTTKEEFVAAMLTMTVFTLLVFGISKL